MSNYQNCDTWRARPARMSSPWLPHRLLALMHSPRILRVLRTWLPSTQAHLYHPHRTRWPSWPSASCPGMCLRSRTVREMRRFYKQVRKQKVPNMLYVSHPACTDSVAYFKYALMHLCSPVNCSVPVPKIKFDIRSRYAFWQRVALSQMRHQGKKKRYIVLYSAAI